MAIENRNLEAGTKLAARYKGTTHTAEVVQTDDGIRYRTEDGQLFMSPSKAGSHVMNGISCNGWRFWSLESELPEPRARHTSDNTARRRQKAQTTRQLRRLPNQKALANGQSRWWCSACMASFVHEHSDNPSACPNGHPMEASDGVTMA